MNSGDLVSRSQLLKRFKREQNRMKKTGNSPWCFENEHGKPSVEWELVEEIVSCENDVTETVNCYKCKHEHEDLYETCMNCFRNGFVCPDQYESI